MAWFNQGEEGAEGLRVVAGDDLAEDLAGDDVHGGGQRYGAVPDVFELAALAPPWCGPPGGVLAGLGLDAGLLIDAEHNCPGRRVAVQIADGLGLIKEGRIVLAVQPAADQVLPALRAARLSPTEALWTL